MGQQALWLASASAAAMGKAGPLPIASHPGPASLAGQHDQDATNLQVTHISPPPNNTPAKQATHSIQLSNNSNYQFSTKNQKVDHPKNVKCPREIFDC